MTSTSHKIQKLIETFNQLETSTPDVPEVPSEKTFSLSITDASTTPQTSVSVTTGDADEIKKILDLAGVEASPSALVPPTETEIAPEPVTEPAEGDVVIVDNAHECTFDDSGTCTECGAHGDTVTESEEEDPDYDKKPVEAHGVKGMKSTPWRRKFKSRKALNAWVEKSDGDVEVHGTRLAEGFGSAAEVLAQFPEETAKLKAGADLMSLSNLYDALYEHYFEEMPYGTSKARDGDPDQWIVNQLEAEGLLSEGIKPSPLADIVYLATGKKVAEEKEEKDSEEESTEEKKDENLDEWANSPKELIATEPQKNELGSIRGYTQKLSNRGGKGDNRLRDANESLEAKYQAFKAKINEESKEEEVEEPKKLKASKKKVSESVQPFKVVDLSDLSDGEAYDVTQTDDSINDGDILKLDLGRWAILNRAWPVMVIGDSNVFHKLKNGGSWKTVDGGRYLAAVSEIQRLASDNTLVSESVILEPMSGEDKAKIVDFCQKNNYAFTTESGQPIVLTGIARGDLKASTIISHLKNQMKVNFNVLEEGKQLLEWPTNSWAILPATMELYGRRTIDIKGAVGEWGDGTILVCKNEQDRICFLYTSGDGYPVGTKHKTHHDQTGASKGVYTVLNNVTFDKNEIVKKDNDVGLNVKASLAVFK